MGRMTPRAGSCLRWLMLWVLVVANAASVGCRSHPQEDGTTSHEKKARTVTGTVVSVDLKLGEATIAHDEIPGFMEAMTMPFPVADPAELGSLRPGDHIRASLVPANPFYRLEHVVIEKRAGGAGGQAEAVSAPSLPPTPGQ